MTAIKDKNNIIRRAIAFAFEAHDGQYRDNKESVPYITHPAQTAQILMQVTNDQELIAAAWLHDTIEDTNTTYEELRELFGKRVADLVLEVTNKKNPDKSSYFPNLKTQDGAILKFADRLSNLSDMSGWSDKRKAAYIKKSTFWTTEAKDAQPQTKGL
jgi:myo-inositol-1(or 4)-monophosphatase